MRSKEYTSDAMRGSIVLASAAEPMTNGDAAARASNTMKPKDMTTANSPTTMTFNELLTSGNASLKWYTADCTSHSSCLTIPLLWSLVNNASRLTVHKG